MRAAVLEAANEPLRVCEVDLEGPGPREVRVRIEACGVCHSDISLVDGTFPMMGPTVAGHEAAGVVVEVGPVVGGATVVEGAVVVEVGGSTTASSASAAATQPRFPEMTLS